MTLFEYIESRLKLVGVCRNNVGLAELTLNKEGESIPASYEGSECIPVENHDYSAGLTYFRIDGEIDREDIQTVPDTILEVSVPFVVVAIAKRSKVSADGRLAPYQLARKVDTALLGSFKIDNSWGSRIESTGIDTNWIDVIQTEFGEVKGWDDSLCAVRCSFEANFKTFERCLTDLLCETEAPSELFAYSQNFTRKENSFYIPLI